MLPVRVCLNNPTLYLAWEPSFSWKLNLRFKSQPTQLQIFLTKQRAFHLFEFWGKLVKGFMIYDRTYKQADYYFVYRDLRGLSLSLSSATELIIHIPILLMEFSAINFVHVTCLWGIYYLPSYLTVEKENKMFGVTNHRIKGISGLILSEPWFIEGHVLSTIM